MSSKNPTQQDLYLNANYVRLVDSNKQALPTSNHSSYQTSKANITGYSNIYNNKQLQMRDGKKWGYEVNRIVSEAREIVGSAEKEEFV